MSTNSEIVIVTGCSGRVGSKVMSRLVQANYKVIGLDIVEPKFLHTLVHFKKMDLTSDESVRQVFHDIKKEFGSKIASLIHLAAYYSFADEKPELYEQITVQGTRRILDMAKTLECEQFIFSSTLLVHEPCSVGEKIKEDSPIEGKWRYPQSKIETEQLIHEQKDDIPTVILRIAGCYDDECHSIPIANQIQRVYEKQLINYLFPGDVRSGNPFLHLDDLAEAIYLAVQKRLSLPKDLTLLVGEDERLSNQEIQNEISQLILGYKIPMYRIPKWFAKVGSWLQNNNPFMEKPFIKPWMIDFADANYDIDTTLARQTLGWKPTHSIRTTLPLMVEILKTHPKKFYRANGLNMPNWLKNQ